MPDPLDTLIAALAGGTCPTCAESRLTLVWERQFPGVVAVLTRSETVCGCFRVLREAVVVRIVHHS